MQNKKSIMDLAGVWSDISEKEAEEMNASINDLRKRSKLRNCSNLT